MTAFRALKLTTIIAAIMISALMSFTVYAQDSIEELEREGVRVWQMLPRPSEMIRHPSAESWIVYGTRKPANMKANDRLPGGQMKIAKNTSVRENLWDIGAQVKNQDRIKKDDVILTAFWARLSPGQSSVKIPMNMQEAGGDYAVFAQDEITITPAWHQYFIYGTAPQKFRKEAMQMSLQLGGAPVEVQLGPVYMMNLGPGDVNAASMPKHTNAAPPQGQNPSALSGRSSTSLSVPAALQSDLSALKAQLPVSGRLIAPVTVESGNPYGDALEFSIVSDPDVPGGQAIDLNNKAPGLDSWSSAVNWPVNEDIQKGDTLLMSFWAKGISAKNESQTAQISPIRVQASGGKYEEAFEGQAYLAPDWKQYYIAGRSNNDIVAGDAGVTFHIGINAQRLRLGPVYLLNLGQGVDPRILPRTKIDYTGREAGAAWRADARAAIDRHRKGEIILTVKDNNGHPLANQSVRITQQSHAFNFGTFTGHKFGPPKTADERAWHAAFDTNFNTVTLPLYWQDWGWSGDKKSEYKSMVKYTTKRGIPWRGHPILWPGETMMPSYILETKNPAKQRKQVLDHVREVMSFVKPYKPFAVDMVNEVRVNQYFIENGNPDLVAESFRLAHEIAPDIPLFVNDYAILVNGGNNLGAIDFYHSWLRRMRADNVPIGGIGFQAHFGAGLTPPHRVRDILKDFAQYDLPLHITEFDIETLDEDVQADYTRDILIAALAEPKLEAFIIWQFWEGDHWKPNAAMYRKDWSEKSNRKAWHETIYRDFWTDQTIKTDVNGQVRLRGFKGDYTASARGQQTSFSLDDQVELTLQ